MKIYLLFNGNHNIFISKETGLSVISSSQMLIPWRIVYNSKSCRIFKNLTSQGTSNSQRYCYSRKFIDPQLSLLTCISVFSGRDPQSVPAAWSIEGLSGVCRGVRGERASTHQCWNLWLITPTGGSSAWALLVDSLGKDYHKFTF